MELLVIVGVVVGLGLAFRAVYQDGKRAGSRKAYGVGFARGRRARGGGQQGCMLVVVAIVAGLLLASALLAR